MPPITLNVSYLETSQLVPKEWADGNQLGYVFNPTICQADHGLSMIYRVVNPDSDIRRIAACRIDANLFPVPGSVVPLSDLIEFVDPNSRDTRALNWHADPRVFCLNGELFVTWNDGSAQPSNHQFMTKLDSTGTRPDGLAREIVTKRNRRPIEKNWMFFCADDKVWCTYSAFPHDVMSVDMRDPEYVVCTPAYSTLSRCEYESHIRRGSGRSAADRPWRPVSDACTFKLQDVRYPEVLCLHGLRDRKDGAFCRHALRQCSVHAAIGSG